jgi:hypothetical protein
MKTKHKRLPKDSDGGPEEDRTPDLIIANDALSQLSYGPTMKILEARYALL